MSISAISNGTLLDYNAQGIQNGMQQFRKEFQQLGQDLQSGNLSAAQADLATLQQLGPQADSAGSAQSSNAIAQEFKQLSQNLQSGNLSAAQQDYATIRQDFQNQAAQAHRNHHRHRGGHNGGSGVSQLLNQLGQALQSGNLSNAQQAYNALQQVFQQSSQNNAGATQLGSNSNSISVNG